MESEKNISYQEKKVSIIIPLYNGYSFFKDCFESVLRNTQKGTYELIIIDDCSTEYPLLDYLERIKKMKRDDIIILKNKENLGFIGSVNRGMQYDCSDVLLLNSDTIVTKNWLKKMSECANSNANIGTVTPITNNGALVSFPKQWKDNKIPGGYTLDTISELIEKISLQLYPEIPSPIGFCMYIKREVIRLVGYFDLIYGKGYGEENDFGMRAYEIGYRHVLDDKTFILHKGSMTFKHFEKKQELVEKNTKILHKRYPELSRLLFNFEKENPLFPIYNNIKLNMGTNFLQKRGILFVSVAEVDEFPSGALQHIKHLINNVDKNINKYVLYRKYDNIILVLYLPMGEKIRYVFNFSEKYSPSQFDHAEIESIWELIINNFNIDLVHFQTPQDLPLSIFKLTKQLGKAVFFTAHDFLLFCPSFVLTRYDISKNTYSFCNYETNEKICRDCLKYRMGLYNLPEQFQLKRRQYIKENVLPYVDRIIFPSKFLKQTTQKLFSGHISDSRAIIIEHGCKSARIPATNRKRNAELHVAFIGSFSEIKGSKIFKDIVKKVGQNNTIKFYIVGRIEDNDSVMMLKNFTNVKIIGHYENYQLKNILTGNKIDVALILSLCPETFSFTISESWGYGIPVITLNIGAQQERVRESGAGWIIDSNTCVNDAVNILQDIMNDQALLSEKIARIPMLASIKENAKIYEDLYKNYFAIRELASFSLSSKKMYRFIQKREREIAIKPLFSLDRSYIKHVAFIFFSRLGIADNIRPIYYKSKHTIEAIINAFQR